MGPVDAAVVALVVTPVLDKLVVPDVNGDPVVALPLGDAVVAPLELATFEVVPMLEVVED